MLNASFGEFIMRLTQVQLWYKRFKKGREDINDDARPGHTSTSATDENIAEVKKMILDNRGISIGSRRGRSYTRCFAPCF